MTHLAFDTLQLAKSLLLILLYHEGEYFFILKISNALYIQALFVFSIIRTFILSNCNKNMLVL